MKILYCTNGNDVDLLCMSINSIKSNWSSHPEIIIISTTPSLPIELQDYTVYIIPTPVINNYSNFKEDEIAIAYTLRIAAFEYLYKNTDTDIILYVDTDTVILSPIINQPTILSCVYAAKSRCDTSCYNAGVLLLSLKTSIQCNGLYDKLFYHNELYKYQIIDQDFLNDFCDFGELPDDYNFYPYGSTVIPSTVKILHFVWQKPWDPYKWFTDEIYDIVLSYLPTWSTRSKLVIQSKANRDLDKANRDLDKIVRSITQF